MKIGSVFLTVLALLVLAATDAFASSYTVFVSYAYSQRPSGFFPAPWAGSSGVTFIGQNEPGIDTGAIP